MLDDVDMSSFRMRAGGAAQHGLRRLTDQFDQVDALAERSAAQRTYSEDQKRVRRLTTMKLPKPKTTERPLPRMDPHDESQGFRVPFQTDWEQPAAQGHPPAHTAGQQVPQHANPARHRVSRESRPAPAPTTPSGIAGAQSAPAAPASSVPGAPTPGAPAPATPTPPPPLPPSPI